ncbi:MAG: hypothetical protein L6R42_000238 [Xanthoria sp. 1 TBL-2021]|nr:MAG: hypothetical protein L6R42_000238 [Xanthoria sp. 1 TBL-2021]
MKGVLTRSGGRQMLERKLHPNCWDFLGTAYLERRRFELAATGSIDGGVGCLSGRTFAIRTGIIQNEQFFNEFQEERWLGFLSLLAADDDNFMTRYLVNHGWGIAVQLTKEAELTTTLEGNSKFLAQCVRWRRTTWRSNFTSLFVDQIVWSFNPPAVMMDSLLGYTLYHAVRASEPQSYIPGMLTSLVTFFLWVMFTKIIKFAGHFHRYPADLKFLPILYLFSYLHGFIYLYSFSTLHKTGWGGGRSGFVSDKEKDGDDGRVYSASDDIESAAGYSGLRCARCSGIDIRLLGDKLKGLTNLSRAQSPVSDLETGEKHRFEKNADIV